jgi:phosphomannomutase
MNNESKIVIGGQESGSLSVKSHDQAKDGVVAHLLAAQTVTACGASLTKYCENVGSQTPTKEFAFGRIRIGGNELGGAS